MRTVALLLLCLLPVACLHMIQPDELTIFGSHTESDSVSGSVNGKYVNGSVSGGGDSNTIGLAVTYHLQWERQRRSYDHPS